MHQASSEVGTTGLTASRSASLATLDPVQVSPAQETLWYAFYAVVLWVVVAVIVVTYGKNLVRRSP